MDVCILCAQDTGDTIYCEEYGLYVHEDCVVQALQEDPYDTRAKLLARELDI
jgi:hypothetical protein